MKKGLTIGIIIVVVAALAAGGIAILQMPSEPTTPVSTAGAATTASSAILVTKTSPSLGQYFTTPNGQPLYTFNGDSKGVSNCTGSCLAIWPAYQDKTGTENLPAGVGTIKRTDNGETQFTYNGMPLYTFVSDMNGQVTGNGVQNFMVAKPASTSASSGQPTSSNAAMPPAAPTTTYQSSNQTSGSGW